MSEANGNVHPWNQSGCAILLTPAVITVSVWESYSPPVFASSCCRLDSSIPLLVLQVCSGVCFGLLNCTGPGLPQLPRSLFPWLFVACLLHLQAENRHANDLLSSYVYCLPFFAGIQGDRFTKYIVQSCYGV